MSPRLNPYAISPEAMQELIAFQEFLRTSDIDALLVEIVRVRTSQLNGCRQGVRRHMRTARNLGETEERLESLAEWRTATCYSAKELVALE
jgi:AhpD family alkylhydroperoxidase